MHTSLLMSYIIVFIKKSRIATNNILVVSRHFDVEPIVIMLKYSMKFQFGRTKRLVEKRLVDSSLIYRQ